MSSPALPPSSFTSRLLALNRAALADFREWIFLPGMQFGAVDKWWGDRGRRLAAHEGIDFRSYADRAGNHCCLSPGILVPLLYPGRVVRICADFLANSLFVVHDRLIRNEKALLSIYGHVAPTPAITVGALLGEGTPVAAIAAPRRQTAAPPHLHLSTAWLPADFPFDSLSWEELRKIDLCCDPQAFVLP